MRYVVRTAVLLAAVTAIAPHPANSIPPAHMPFESDTTVQRSDSVPPPAPAITVKHISRGQGLVYLDGGRIAKNSEGDYGSIALVISFGDASVLDSKEIGYRFHLVDGDLPARLDVLPAGAWCAHKRGDGIWISITWSDGETWKQDAFKFRMYVTAVDRAGNESLPSNVVVVGDDGIQDAQYESQRRGDQLSSQSIDALIGNWVGKDEVGADARLSMAGRQFYALSGADDFEGFAQVWKDAEGKDQMTVDTELGVTYTGPYELQGERLRLWLRSPNAQKYYDLRRN